MYTHILPDFLEINGTIHPEVRNRGIYEVVLYNSELHFNGKVLIPDLGDLKISAKDIIWKDAFISVGITDMKGIEELITFEIDDNDYLANSGIETNDVIISELAR